MSKKSDVLVQDLRSRFISLERTRVKMEKLFKEGSLSRSDIEKVYESLFMRTITYFEGFIEELFFGLVTNKVKLPVGSTSVKIEFKNETLAREIVFAGKNYYDWFPYDQTEKLAKRFLRDGHPFTMLNIAPNDKKDAKNDISNMLIVRNVIAHQSSFSKKRFQEEVISKALGLLPREKSPAGFLRNQFRVSPDQTRFENYQLRIVDIAKKIAG